MDIRQNAHNFSIFDVIYWARYLSKLPVSIVFYGIEPANMDLGNQLSPLVKQSLSKLIHELTKEIKIILST